MENSSRYNSYNQSTSSWNPLTWGRTKEESLYKEECCYEDDDVKQSTSSWNPLNLFSRSQTIGEKGIVDVTDYYEYKPFTVADMSRCFNVWGEKTLPSKFDQLIWVAAERRFALLGRDKVDFKLDKEWYTGILYPVHLLSESVLATTKTLGGLFYKQNAIHVYSKINEMVSIFKNTICGDVESLALVDFPELKNTVTKFSEGLEKMDEGYIEMEQLAKVKEDWDQYESLSGLKRCLNDTWKKVDSLLPCIDLKIKECEVLKENTITTVNFLLGNLALLKNDFMTLGDAGKIKDVDSIISNIVRLKIDNVSKFYEDTSLKIANRNENIIDIEEDRL